MSNKSKDYSFFSPLDYKKYSNLHITFESRNKKILTLLIKKLILIFLVSKKL